MGWRYQVLLEMRARNSYPIDILLVNTLSISIYTSIIQSVIDPHKHFLIDLDSPLAALMESFEMLILLILIAYSNSFSLIL